MEDAAREAAMDALEHFVAARILARGGEDSEPDRLLAAGFYRRVELS